MPFPLALCLYYSFLLSLIQNSRCELRLCDCANSDKLITIFHYIYCPFPKASACCRSSASNFSLSGQMSAPRQIPGYASDACAVGPCVYKMFLVCFVAGGCCRHVRQPHACVENNRKSIAEAEAQLLHGVT